MSKVSVIIPVYNVENYLKFSLDSVINQTLKDIEIICINDCSPDNSIKILEEYSKQDKRIRIINLEKNSGQGIARDIAVKEATGDYIMFLDPDDYLELDACEKAYNQITANNNDFVIFDFINFYDESDEKSIDSTYTNVFKSYLDVKNIEISNCDFIFYKNVFAWNKIYKTSFLKENKIEFSSYRFLEDSIFFTKLLSVKSTFSILPIALYNYRKKESSNMTIDYTNYYSQIIDVHFTNYTYLKNLDNKLLLKNFIVYSINSLFHWFDKFTSINKNIEVDFYAKLHSYFNKIYSDNDIKLFSNYINLKKFMLIVNNEKNSKYKNYQLRKNLLNKIFSIKKSEGTKKITILGMNLKFNLSDKFISETENYIIYRFGIFKLKFRKIGNNKIYIVNKKGKKYRVPFVFGLKIEFAGENSTVILHSPVIKFKNSRIFLRSNCCVEIGSSKNSAKKLLVLALGNNLSLKIGNNFHCTNDCQFVFSKEEGMNITVGDNCMFGSNIMIRTSDAHTIFDRTTGKVLNYASDVVIKDNVWLAMNTTVLKGVTIEEGSVIGTCSVVTKSCDEPYAIYAGIPAKKVKSNINWSRDSIPDYLEKLNK